MIENFKIFSQEKGFEMKISSEIAAKDFTPVKIKIIIESLEELSTLYAMANASSTSLISSKSCVFNLPEPNLEDRHLINKLSDICHHLVDRGVLRLK